MISNYGMKTTYSMLRVCIQGGIKLNRKISLDSSRVACIKCAMLTTSRRCFSSNDTSKVISGETYFKDLSKALHSEDTSTGTGSSEIARSEPKIKFDVEVIKKYDTTHAIEDVEDEVFDSLAEKTVNFDDVPKLTSLSFNLASYVNKSETLQQLVKLGVDLSKWEAMEKVPEMVLKLDFEKDIQKYITFLHDVGVPADQLGHFLTKNPMIFNKRIEDLQVRINYLESKKFSTESIGRILTRAPHFLLFSTRDIDRRLGYFQKEFALSGDEVRSLITRSPKLAIWNFIKLKDKHFSLKEEMGFNSEELKTLLLTKPKIWLMENRSLLDRFDYVQNTMKIPHEMIVAFPGCLLLRRFQLRQRHLFLVALNRAQYDPTRPRFVSLQALSAGNDFEFCTSVAKSSVKKFNDFLKTL